MLPYHEYSLLFRSIIILKSTAVTRCFKLKKLFVVTVFAIFLGIIGSFFYFSSEREVKQQKDSTVVSAEKEPSEKIPASQKYCVKEYKGNIAVFESGSDMPFKTTSVSVSELPPEDRKLLEEGIVVSSEKDLSTIMEDYCS